MTRDVLIPPRFDVNGPEMSRYARLLWEQISQMNQGKMENARTVTLDASSATTVVNHPGFESTMSIYFIPKTANAAAEQGNATMYISAKTTNQFTITHHNNTQTDRTFDYVVFG